MKWQFVYGMMIVLSMALAGFAASVQVASATTYDFSLDTGYWHYSRWYWPDAETYTVTLDVTVDYDSVNSDYVDVYFVDNYNYGLYDSGSSFTYLLGYTYVGEGTHTYTLSDFTPVANAYYWVLIDNTNRYTGAPPVTYVSGSISLSSVQTSSASYTLSGQVVASGTHAGISGATVILSPGSRTTTTNPNGYYYFYNLPSGAYSLTFSASGYEVKSDSLTIYTSDRSFDVIMYSKGTGSSWILGVIGGVAVVAALVIVVILVAKKRSRSKVPKPESLPGVSNPDMPRAAAAQPPIESGISSAPPPPQTVSPQPIVQSGTPAYMQQIAQPQPQVNSPPPPQFASDSRFCQSCGSPVTGFGKFCKNCGAAIK